MGTMLIAASTSRTTRDGRYRPEVGVMIAMPMAGLAGLAGGFLAGYPEVGVAAAVPFPVG
jgi:hypothetical protein